MPEPTPFGDIMRGGMAPPMAPNPWDPKREYGVNLFPKLDRSLDILNTIAGDPSRSGELTAMLMGAQYGGGTSGGFGDYLRSQANTIGLINQFARPWGFAGAYETEPYKRFEDIYESLGAGKGTAMPGQTSISDWRNRAYQSLLGGSEAVRTDEPGTLGAAQQYLNQFLQPLLGSTMTQTDFRILQNLIPDLFARYSRETEGVSGPQTWAQWLNKGGYIPGQAK